jgi:type IV pilus assembly protein PilB
MAKPVFERVVEQLVLNGAVTRQRADSLPTPERMDMIISQLAAEGVDGINIADAVGAVLGCKVYDIDDDKDNISQRGKDWLISRGTLFLINPFSQTFEKLISDRRNNQIEFDESEFGVLPYSALGVSMGHSDNGVNEQEAEALLRKVIEEGITLNASDVHVAPESGEGVIRYRLDGRLVVSQVKIPYGPQYEAFSNRLLSRANGEPGVFNKTHSGRFPWELAGRNITIRVEMNPVRVGLDLLPKFTMRYLGLNIKLASLEHLALSEKDMAGFKEMAKLRDGVLLVTGPTGSGKTTTLYAHMKYMQSEFPYKSFSTLEDPVEIEVKGFNQTEVDGDQITWESGLVSLLRSDPDVILLGEIRDATTATQAVRAALTGHMVLSTLHTNKAIDAVSRLLDLGIKPQILSDALAGISAQRMARRVCKVCAKRVRYSDYVEYYEKYADVPGLSGDTFILVENDDGCSACNNEGFIGRQIINELILITPDLTKMIAENRPAYEISAALKASGHKDLLDDGVRLINEHCTTFSEIEDALGSSHLIKYRRQQ